METYAFSAAIKAMNFLDLSIYFYGYAKLDHQWHGQNSALPVDRLYIPKSGTAVIGVGPQKLEMRAGYAYLIPAETPMDFVCEGEMEKLYFHFNLFRSDRYDALSGLNRIYEIPYPVEAYEPLFRQGMNGEIWDTMIIKAQFYDILARFQKAYNLISEHIPVYSKTVLNTIAYIQENLSATLHLEDLAKRCYVSRSTLTDVFRKEVGISLGKYIDDQLIASAQRQLCQSSASIGQISNSLGYSNQCYFSRRFKQICGMTPQVYRARNKNYKYSSV